MERVHSYNPGARTGLTWCAARVEACLLATSDIMSHVADIHCLVYYPFTSKILTKYSHSLTEYNFFLQFWPGSGSQEPWESPGSHPRDGFPISETNGNFSRNMQPFPIRVFKAFIEGFPLRVLHAGLE